MIFTVLDIKFSKEQLRKLLYLTDKNKDGKIDSKEFSRMLYSVDEDTMAKKNQLIDEDSDIEVVDEASNESDEESENEENPDARLKAQIKSGMLANRERVISAKRGIPAPSNIEETKQKADQVELDDEIEDESV